MIDQGLLKRVVCAFALPSCQSLSLLRNSWVVLVSSSRTVWSDLSIIKFWNQHRLLPLFSIVIMVTIPAPNTVFLNTSKPRNLGYNRSVHPLNVPVHGISLLRSLWSGASASFSQCHFGFFLAAQWTLSQVVPAWSWGLFCSRKNSCWWWWFLSALLGSIAWKSEKIRRTDWTLFEINSTFWQKILRKKSNVLLRK